MSKSSMSAMFAMLFLFSAIPLVVAAIKFDMPGPGILAFLSGVVGVIFAAHAVDTAS